MMGRKDASHSLNNPRRKEIEEVVVQALALEASVLTAKESLQLFWRINLDVLLEGVPEWLVIFSRASEEQVVHVDREHEPFFLEPKA